MSKYFYVVFYPRQDEEAPIVDDFLLNAAEADRNKKYD